MIHFTEREAVRWARLGPRATYGLVMNELVQKNENVYVLSADLGGSSGLQRLIKAYPERYYNVGIAEQNLIGVAAGMAKEGLIPFASSFAPFITMRCCDQIKMNMGYMQLNIKTVGLGSGISMSDLGNSHYGIEDIAIMRAIPNIVVLSPADCSEVAKCVFAAAEHNGPVYIRLTGVPGAPVVYKEDFDFQIGKANILKEGKDFALVATGSMVATALKVSECLAERGICCTVVDMHTIKPLDTEVLDYITSQCDTIV